MKKLLLLITFPFLSLFAESASDFCNNCDLIAPEFTLKPSDKFNFGRLWQQIRRLESEGILTDMIIERKNQIHTIKEHWKAIIDEEKLEFRETFYKNLKIGKLIPATRGCGAAYFLLDENDLPKYVVKPFDEDILCLNNRKFFASPYNNLAFRVREEIPLYRSAQAECLAYELAKLLDIEHLTPETHMAIISHEQFHDISHSSADLTLYEPDEKEKLCSVQTFLHESKSLYRLVEEWIDQDSSDEDMLLTIDQEDFEKLSIFIWCLYDTDAHAGNFYAVRDEKYHLIKIDNGLAFPNKNIHMLNSLYFFPNAKLPLSTNAKKLIANLPIKKIIEKFQYFEMEDALDAFLERTRILQQLGKRELTIQEIDMRLRALELPQGEEIALSSVPLKELAKLVHRESILLPE